LQREVVIKRVSFAMENKFKRLKNARNIVLNNQCGKSINGFGDAGLFAHFNLEIFP